MLIFLVVAVCVDSVLCCTVVTSFSFFLSGALQ